MAKKKPKTTTLEVAIIVRVTPAERAEFHRCAKEDHRTLSSWVRTSLIKAAQYQGMGTLPGDQ